MIAEVERPRGELDPSVGFIVANGRSHPRMSSPSTTSRACERWIEEGKGAIQWTWPSCRSFAANAARLQLHALAYNLGNFLGALAMPEPIKD
ncbi:MAG: transposase [Roseiarcus sp.]